MGTPTTATFGTSTATVTSVQLQGHRSQCSEEDDGETKALDYYLIQWNANTTPLATAGCTDGTNTVPLRGAVNPTNASLLVKNVLINFIDANSLTLLEAKIEYSDQQDGLINPLTQPREITWDIPASGEVPYFYDNDPAGPKPVVTTAGELFADFLQRRQGSTSATYKINIGPAAFNVSMANQYAAPTPAVNSDTFTFDGFSVAPGLAIWGGCQCSEVQTLNGVKYRTLSIKLEFSATGWTQVVDNRGFNEAYTISGIKKLREIIKGVPPVKPERPWPLSATGAAQPNITDNPFPTTFYPYPKLAFAPWSFT